MKKQILTLAYLLLCILVITLAISAGKHHTHCRECALAVNR